MIRRFVLVIALFALLLPSQPAAGQKPADPPATGRDVPGKGNPLPAFPLHPPVVRRDAGGNPLPAAAAGFSVTRTCGACHDTGYIRAHDSHAARGVDIGCLACHTASGTLSADPVAAAAQIQPPADAQCGACHGLVHTGPAPLLLPPTFASVLSPSSLTQRNGTIFSARTPADSGLNPVGKQTLQTPWDIHAARGIACRDCHPGRDPADLHGTPATAAHLRRDPRRTPDAAERLRTPDHRLSGGECRLCHDADSAHASLPYRRRHLQALACQVCHVPRLNAPALSEVDRTVVTETGGPRLEFRGWGEAQPGDTLNTRTITGFTPPLAVVGGNGDARLEPVNPILEWRWIDGDAAHPLSDEFVAGVLRPGGQDDPEFVALLDRDGDKRLSAAERRLDTPAKVEWLAARLRRAGVAAPRIQTLVHWYPVRHGVQVPAARTADCTACHGSAPRLRADMVLSTGGPAVTDAAQPASDGVASHGRVERGLDGAWSWSGRQPAASWYLPGLTRSRTMQRLGLGLFLAVLLGVGLHMLLRRRRRAPAAAHRAEEATAVPIYPLYERLWHWTMAVSVVLLAVTGLAVHWAGGFPLLGLAAATAVHNAMAVVLTVNAFLALFFHAAGGGIRQYFVFHPRFFHEVVLQLHFYLKGFFAHAPHPIAKSPQRKFNPLQQVTYVVLLNLLLPLQVVTGFLLWAGDRWPGAVARLGGLGGVVPWHNLGSWLLLSFLTLHVYLITTGHSPASAFRAMITGNEVLPPGLSEEERRRLLALPLPELVSRLTRGATDDAPSTGDSR